MKDEEFDEKVYSALNKKLLSDFEFNEDKDLGYYVGTTVLVFLAIIGLAYIFEVYRASDYNKPVINHEKYL